MGKKKSVLKRSVLIATALTALLSETAKAHFYYFELGSYSDLDTRTRWSVYKHGLISGDWKWSPYSGSLVPGEVRYSPYAFSPSHPSGLVWENRGVSLIKQQNILYNPSPDNTTTQPETKSFEELKAEDEAKQSSIRESIANRKEKIEKRNEARRNDPVNKIYEYLAQNKRSFKNFNPLIINHKVVGTSFFLDGKKAIQYINLDEIKNQQGFVRIKACQNYLEDLQKLLRQSAEKGWSFCLVTSENGKINGLESLLK